jgi:hypothetical protein
MTILSPDYATDLRAFYAALAAGDDDAARAAIEARFAHVTPPAVLSDEAYHTAMAREYAEMDILSVDLPSLHKAVSELPLPVLGTGPVPAWDRCDVAGCENAAVTTHQFAGSLHYAVQLCAECAKEASNAS